MNGKIKSAEEILRKHENLMLNPNKAHGNIHILAMKEYASQFLDLAIEDSYTIYSDGRYVHTVPLEELKEIKQLIK